MGHEQVEASVRLDGDWHLHHARHDWGMKKFIYLLKAKGDVSGVLAHDCACAFAVRARTAKEARMLAATQCGDEGPVVWTDSTMSSCRVVGGQARGKSEVLVRDFLGG